MSANETLDVDEFEARYADALCSIRKPLPIRVADVLLAVPRLIAALRERDKKIADLRAEADAYQGAFKMAAAERDNFFAAVRERDAEIARLKQDQPRIPNAARLTTIANMIDRECDKFTFHWPTKRTETLRSEAAFLRALAGQAGTEPPQPAEGAS